MCKVLNSVLACALLCQLIESKVCFLLHSERWVYRGIGFVLTDAEEYTATHIVYSESCQLKELTEMDIVKTAQLIGKSLENWQNCQHLGTEKRIFNRKREK